MKRFMGWRWATLAAAVVPAARAMLASAGFVAALPALAEPAAAASETCAAGDGGLSISRVVEIDASTGPLFGQITKEIKEQSFLKPKEVVLTFDDGPMPWVTNSILDTLDKFCTKATFFSVGKMAIAYPATLRKVIERGHTLGGHTWSHPLNLKRLGHAAAMAEIEKGFAAISLASGGQAAPFFRFPGLSDNAKMLDALQKRGIASFSVDVVSDDSYISNPAKLVSTTLSRVDVHQGGILLFHDIKPATAKALPTILGELKKRGYKIVHMRGKSNVTPLKTYTEELQPVLAKKDPPQGQAVAKAAMLPFFGAVGPERVTGTSHAPEAEAPSGVKIDVIAPAARDRSAPAKAGEGAQTGKVKGTGKAASGNGGIGRSAAGPSIGDSVTLRGHQVGDTWSARVRRERLNRTLYD